MSQYQQCTSCLGLIEEYKGTSYYPYIPMSWRLANFDTISKGAIYTKTGKGWHGSAFYHRFPDHLRLVMHLFPYDDEYNTSPEDMYYLANSSLCTRSGIYPDISYVPLSVDVNEIYKQVVIKSSNAITIQDIIWLIAHKFRRERQNLFIGGSYVLSMLRPDLNIKVPDIDMFVLTSNSSRGFYRNVAHSLFECGDPEIPINKIDMTILSQTESFFHYNDMSITRPVIVFCQVSNEPETPADHLVALCMQLTKNLCEKFILTYIHTIKRGEYGYSFFILATESDLNDVQEGHIQVRVKRSSKYFPKSETRIQKYMDRGFKKVTYLDLYNHGCVTSYLDEQSKDFYKATGSLCW